jgi:hypothetical protein
MLDPVMRSMTRSATLADTSTVVWDSRTSTLPMSPLVTPGWLAIDPTMSAGRAPSREPTFTNKATMLPGSRCLAGLAAATAGTLARSARSFSRSCSAAAAISMPS